MKRKRGYLTTRRAKGRAIVALARTTPRGKGRIAKRRRARLFHKKK